MDLMNATSEDIDRWNELTTLIPICGCGQPSDTIRYIITILKAIRNRSEQRCSKDSVMALQRSFGLPLDKDGYLNHLAGMFLLYMLDHLELIEHGGNVIGGWLSEKGRRAIDLYTQLESLIVKQCFDDPSLTDDKE